MYHFFSVWVGVYFDLFFFLWIYGLFPLNSAFFWAIFGISRTATQVSCTHNVFLFVSFLRSLVLKVCHLIHLSVNLALYILVFLCPFHVSWDTMSQEHVS